MTEPAKPAPAAPVEKTPKPVFKLAEIRDDGTAIVEDEAGRMFAAELKEGAERPRKGSFVELTYKELGPDGVPVEPKIK